MDKLISKAAAIDTAIEAVDCWDGGYNPNREEVIRKHFETVPTIDAIPVKWMEAQDNIAVKATLAIWQKEQEANRINE